MAAAKKQKSNRRSKARKTSKTKGQKAKSSKSSKPSKASKVSKASKPSKTSKVSKTSKPRHPLDGTPVTILIVSPGIVSAGQEYFPGVANNTQFFFKNNSTLDLTLNFTGSSGNLSVPKGQTVGPISASGTAISYTITNTVGTLTGGPYAIQWNNGVLEVTINSDAPDFDPVAVVPRGLIHFTAYDGDYTIKWQTQNGQQVNIWSPQPPVIYQTPAPNPVQKAMAGVNGPYNYVLTAKNLAIGGGTVKVGS